MVWMSFKLIGILFILIETTSSETELKSNYENSNKDYGDSGRENNYHLPKHKNYINSMKQYFKYLQRTDVKNVSQDSINLDDYYLNLTSSFEILKINNSSNKFVNSNDSSKNNSLYVMENVLPVLLRKLRLADPTTERPFITDRRQRERHRHSKRVKIIKPVHYLLPPRKHDYPELTREEIEPLYKAYKQYKKLLGEQSDESFNSDNEDSSKLSEMDILFPKKRVQIKRRRRPIGHLRPPVITLTTAEHIFYVTPKYTTTSLPEKYDNRSEILMNHLKSDTRPEKIYNDAHTTTEVNDIYKTTYIESLFKSTDDLYKNYTPSLYDYTEPPPVTVYSMEDIFGLKNRTNNKYNLYNESKLKGKTYIPEDSKRTNTDKYALPKIQPEILIQEINSMFFNSNRMNDTDNRSFDNKGTNFLFNDTDIIASYTESYFEVTKINNENLMAPDVQKTGMSVSKLDNYYEKNPSQFYWQTTDDFIKDHNNSFKYNDYINEEHRPTTNRKYILDKVNPKEYMTDHPNTERGLSVAETAHFRRGMLSKNSFLLQQRNVIPGEAGSDYPILSKPPVNSRFSCKADGRRYVADVSSGCQVFFMCVGDGPGEPMLCPNGTLFSQDFLVCDWWYNVDCHY